MKSVIFGFNMPLQVFIKYYLFINNETSYSSGDIEKIIIDYAGLHGLNKIFVKYGFDVRRNANERYKKLKEYY